MQSPHGYQITEDGLDEDVAGMMALSDADVPYNQLPKIDKFRYILANHAARQIDGTLIDVQSANAVVLVYDALSEKTQKLFVAMDAAKMVTRAWKLVG